MYLALVTLIDKNWQMISSKEIKKMDSPEYVNCEIPLLLSHVIAHYDRII